MTQEQEYFLYQYDFEGLASKEPDGRARIRLLALHHYSQNRTTSYISESLCIHPDVARRIRKRFRSEGISSVYGRVSARGRKSKLPPELYEDFKLLILEMQKEASERLRCQDVVDLVKERYNVEYTITGMYELLKRLNIKLNPEMN